MISAKFKLDIMEIYSSELEKSAQKILAYF